MEFEDTQSVEDNGLGEIIFPAYDKWIAPIIKRDGLWEKDEVFWLLDNLAPGDTCINIGANVGYFAATMAKLVGSKGHVYAIEPHPSIFKLLEVNMSCLSLANYSLYNIAAGDTEKIITLFQNDENCGDHRVFDPRTKASEQRVKSQGFSSSIKEIDVQQRRVDETIFPSRLDAILCDTQGWDYFALLGSTKLITKFCPKIITEFDPIMLSQVGLKPEDVLFEFVRWGYQIRILANVEWITIKPREVLKWIKNTGHEYCNLFLEPTNA